MNMGMLAFALASAFAAVAAPDVTMCPDGEVATLQDALERVRDLRAAGTIAADRMAEVRVEPGRYFVRQSAIFEPQDSNLRFTAASGGEAVIDGGVWLPPFTVGTDGVWRTDVPTNLVFEQLYVNGRRAQRAREPNQFFHYMEAPWNESLDWGQGFPGSMSGRAFVAAPADLAKLEGLSFDELRRVEIRFWQSWDQAVANLDAVDIPRGLVVARGGTSRSLFYWSTTKPRYAFENLRTALDAPGEWFLDVDAHVLLYLPLPGETVGTTHAVAPCAPEFVFFSADPLNGTRVRNVEFNGIAFEHCSWTLPSAGVPNAQSAQNVRTAAFFGDGAEGVKLVGCRISHTGAHGVWLKRGSRHNLIANCRIEDLGGGGIYLGDTAGWASEPESERCGFNVISNCIVRSGGLIFNGAIGVWIGHGTDNTIIHNDIGDFRYTGVSMGWTWGYAATMNRRNALLWNRIHHIGQGVLSDMGGVYTLGNSEGTVGIGNWIHDVNGYAGAGAAAWGLYTDEGSAGIVYTSNLVERCRAGAVHQHYGTGNTFRNNLFVDYGSAGVARTREDGSPSFSMVNNVFWWTNQSVRVLSGSSSHAITNLVFENNLYGGTTSLASNPYCGRSKTSWNQAGHDLNSLYTDPQFVNPAARDWTLKSSSPARRLGFVPWDWTDAGVLKADAAWRAAAMDDSSIPPLQDAPSAPVYTPPSTPAVPTPSYTVHTNTWRTSVANTPATAYDWNDAAHWSNGGVPGPCDEVNVASMPSPVYVRVTSAVTNAHLSANGNLRLLGDDFHLSSLNGTRGMTSGVTFFGDVVNGSSRDTSALWLVGVNFAGRVIANGADVVPAGGMITHRLDWYAVSSNPLRRDDLQVAADRTYFPGSASVAFYAPEGADACTGTWNQSAGSPFLTRVGAEHPIAVGTRVTGAGIPAGAFVRRRFAANSIELSAAATTTATANVLRFDAFTPDVRFQVPTFARQGLTSTEFKLFRKRTADTMRFEMDVYRVGANQVNYHGLTAADMNSHCPGTHVIHQVSGTGARMVLRNCHLELAGAPCGHETVFGSGLPVSFDAATSLARITVPDGVRARVEVFTNWTGTLVKDGGGLLTIGLADAVNPGRLVVEGGRVRLDGGRLSRTAFLKSLEMRDGAELALPAGGMEIGEASLARNAKVRGVLRPQASVATGTEPRQAAGHPAFWVDASRPETLDVQAVNGTNFVVRWRDCRDGEPMFCTNICRRSMLSSGPTMAERYVRIGNIVTEELTNTEQLVWSVPIGGIKTVFLVQDPSEGGGEILGRCSWRLGNSYYGSRGGPYYRGGSLSLSRPLVSSSYATSCVLHGRFFLNGHEVDGSRQGYLGKRMQIVTHCVNPEERASGSVKDLWCDAFGTGYVDHPGDGLFVSSANGGMRIAECLVYTNELTFAERVQTERYLAWKWLGHDSDSPLTENGQTVADAPLVAGGEAVEVPAGESLLARGLTGGTTFAKTGGGTLYLEAVTNGEATVEEGELVIRSVDAEAIAADSWVHLDASARDSVETTIRNGETQVAKWRNLVNTNEYYRAYSGESGLWGTKTMNGLPLVDLGESTKRGGVFRALRQVKADGSQYAKLSKGPWVDAPEFQTVFVVADSSGGGASLLGADNNGYPAVGFPHAGSSDFSAPMIGVDVGRSDLVWGISTLSNEWATGKAVFRRNGTEVNPFSEPFSGGGDVYAIRLDGTPRRADALGVYGYGAVGGGLAYGEVLIYPYALGERAFAEVEAYLLKKWKGISSDGCGPSRLERLTMAADARLSVVRGTLELASLACSGMATGKLRLKADGELRVTRDGTGNLQTLVVDGTLDLSSGGRVVLDSVLPTRGSYPLVVATQIKAGPFVVVGADTTYPAQVKIVDGTVFLVISDRSTLLRLR